MDHLYYFCLVLLCFLALLFVDALWSIVGKGLASWLSFVMFNCDVVTLRQVCCLIVSILDLCPLSNFNKKRPKGSWDIEWTYKCFGLTD